MNLILFGFKGSGKTYFGKKLGERLNLPFIDTDLLIDPKKSMRALCLELGEAHFRHLEKQAIFSLKNVTGSLIALGGGAIIEPENAQFLQGIGQLVYLDVDKELLKERIFSHELPSILDREEPEASFERLYAERRCIYEKIPAIHIKTHGKRDEQVLKELEHLYLHGGPHGE